MLKVHPEIEIVAEASQGLEALELAVSHKPDAIFLDIEMPELNGLAVAEALAQPNHRLEGDEPPRIVFVTAFDEHAIKAFEREALDYILKPVAPERLATTIERLKRGLVPRASQAGIHLTETGQGARPLDRIAVRAGARFVVVELTRISAILAREHYSALQCDGKEYLLDESLDRMMSRLDKDQFMKIHRGAIINLKYLKELRHDGDRKYTAILGDVTGTVTAVSREALPLLMRRLGVNKP